MNYNFVNLIFAFNRDLLKVEQTGARTLGAKELEYAKICIREEADELANTWSVEDDQDRAVEQVDAFVDALYFSVGHLYRMGNTEESATNDLRHHFDGVGTFDMPIEMDGVEALHVEALGAFRNRMISNVESLHGLDRELDCYRVEATIECAMGGLLCIGLTKEQIYRVIEIVDEKNKQKKKGSNAKRDLGIEDAVKPEGWTSPESAIKEYLFGAK